MKPRREECGSCSIPDVDTNMNTITTDEKMRALQAEYVQRRPELLRTKRGRFVVLAEAGVRADFGSAAEALAFALEHYSEGEFVIKQVVDPDPESYSFVNPYVRVPR